MNTMLFKSPGHKVRPDGTYSGKIFGDSDVEAALAAGWSKTPREAIEATKPVEAKPKRGRPRKSEE